MGGATFRDTRSATCHTRKAGDRAFEARIPIGGGTLTPHHRSSGILATAAFLL